MPRSAERRSKHPAAGPQAQINRRLESYRLETEKSCKVSEKGLQRDKKKWLEIFSLEGDRMDCVVLIMGKLYIQMVVSGEEQLRS